MPRVVENGQRGMRMVREQVDRPLDDTVLGDVAGSGHSSRRHAAASAPVTFCIDVRP